MRIAILGVSHWHAAQYVRGLQELRQEIVAVSDSNADIATERAGEIGCRSYPCAMQLIQDEKPDFVFAHAIHADMTRLAERLVDSGTPFAMEKPMGTDWQALKHVAGKARERGLFAGVDLVMRGYRLSRELCRLKQEGRLGRVTYHTHRLLAGNPSRYRDWNVPWVLDPERAGGGPLFNFGPHVIDLALLLVGAPVEKVFCRSSGLLHGLEINDYSSVSLSFQNGAVATLEVGYVCPGSRYDRVFSLCTEHAFVTTNDFKKGTIVFRDGNEVDVARPDALPGLDYVDDVLTRFREGRPPMASIDDMVSVLRIINAAVESAKTGQDVRLT